MQIKFRCPLFSRKCNAQMIYSARRLVTEFQNTSKRHIDYEMHEISYFRTRKNNGLKFSRRSGNCLLILSYSDVDYDMNRKNQRSISGMVTLTSGTPIYWYRKFNLQLYLTQPRQNILWLLKKAVTYVGLPSWY